MRTPRLVATAAALLLPAALAPLTQLAAHADPAPAYTVTTLHFKVTVAPNNGQVCDVVGDVYVPAGASSTARVPAILTTNGFGGSKDDQAGLGKAFAERGYAVLSYSGLGFGGSSCKITLDDPDYDGKAGSQLVSYLGGKDGIAYLDAAHTQPAPVLDVVEQDTTDHLGHASTFDPRVGTIGGSYGGGSQFATAAVDPRVDTLVPLITWNDLSYSLAPNNTDQTTGVSTKHSGSAKLLWAAGFSALGMASDLQNQQVPPDAIPCPNFADWVCPALATAGTTGYLQPGDVTHLRHASVATFMSKIRVPVLLIQGENDTLFNLNEAVATFKALRAKGTPVKMIWQSWGHSGSTPAPGELDLAAPDPASQYETGRIVTWLDHYLKGTAGSTGPLFSYFRDWVDYSGNASPAYGVANSFPVGVARTYRLSGSDQLVTGATPAAAGSQSFLTPPAGAPTTFDTADVLGGYVGQIPPLGDLPGTYASWTTPTLTSNVNVVGSPTVKLKVTAPTAALTQGVGEAGELVLFVKVADVGPDGKASLIHGLEAPVRIPDVTKPFTVTLPGIVHQFAPGHQLRLIVAGGSLNYRGGLTPVPVTIASGSTQTLTLPVVP
ncbi:CocE/NonD family hydrolase [Nocardioides panacisoli]|uniref:Xaa-Pro dipeptidyl-peptidase C-terminal domain-containing protein n=1 Tax=Nocardioides panacisoli TaxID=627624 RepID=A0ABP7ISJ2_9ACTN